MTAHDAKTPPQELTNPNPSFSSLTLGGFENGNAFAECESAMLSAIAKMPSCLLAS